MRGKHKEGGREKTSMLFGLCLLAFCFLLFVLLLSIHPVFQSLTHILWQLGEAVPAERLALVIVHCTLERFVATVASETGRMPNLSDGTDTIVLDDLLAARTDLTEQLVVVELAVRLIIMLVVCTLNEGLTADAAAETLWMPCASKGGK